MRYVECIVFFFMILLGQIVCADVTAADQVVVNTSAQPYEVRDYKVTAVVKGKLPLESGLPTDIDATFSYKIRHRYLRREGDGLLPLEISLLQGEVSAQEQKLALSPDLYPKLTLLIDKNWKITDIFGLPDTQLIRMLPGINYSNLIILFYLSGGNVPRSVGSVWEAMVTLPSLGHTYKFVNTLKGVQSIGNTKAAVIKQEIIRVPSADESAPTAMKASGESVLSLAEGKLLKSHLECEVVGKQNEAQFAANIKIEVELSNLRS